MDNNVVYVCGRASARKKEIAKKVALMCFKLKGYAKKFEVSISFVSEQKIQTLNRLYRKVDRVTDVLSFPMTNASPDVLPEPDEIDKFSQNNIYLGDIAICVKQLERQAKEYGVSVEDELKKLVIHSMLHLMGYDHIKDGDFEIMKSEEERLSKLIVL